MTTAGQKNRFEWLDSPWLPGCVGVVTCVAIWILSYVFWQAWTVLGMLVLACYYIGFVPMMYGKRLLQNAIAAGVMFGISVPFLLWLYELAGWVARP